MAERVKLLAFDTSSHACSVALLNAEGAASEQGSVQSLHRLQPLQQGNVILPMIDEILDHCALSMQDLDGLAYGCGPGSFTGIRIASCVAQGIGFAANLPVIPISSLRALAQTIYAEKHWEKILIVLDARMGQAYWACYEVQPDGLMTVVGIEQASLVTDIVIPDHWQVETWYGGGDGWIRYQQELTVFYPCQVDAVQLPSARAILPIARERFKQGDWVAAEQALPVYLR